MRKTTQMILAALLLLATGAQAAGPIQGPAVMTEDWKGNPGNYEFTLGFMTGLALVDHFAGLAFVFAPAKKIVHQGFVPDIANQVFIEPEFGAALIRGSSVFTWGLHLRWDFQKDNTWTLYAIGGVGGNAVPASLGDRVEFFPRVGVGVFYRIDDLLSLRGELSHELTVVGASLNF